MASTGSRVTGITIPRLELRVRGIDASVVSTALERLPVQLAAALQRTRHGVSERDHASLRVPAGVNGDDLSIALAERIASIVRQRTHARVSE